MRVFSLLPVRAWRCSVGLDLRGHHEAGDWQAYGLKPGDAIRFGLVSKLGVQELEGSGAVLVPGSETIAVSFVLHQGLAIAAPRVARATEDAFGLFADHRQQVVWLTGF